MYTCSEPPSRARFSQSELSARNIRAMQSMLNHIVSSRLRGIGQRCLYLIDPYKKPARGDEVRAIRSCIESTWWRLRHCRRRIERVSLPSKNATPISASFIRLIRDRSSLWKPIHEQKCWSTLILVIEFQSWQVDGSPNQQRPVLASRDSSTMGS